MAAKNGGAWLSLPANWNQEPRYFEITSVLGDSARSLPCDLWAFCANHARDGDLSGYSDSALARCINYGGAADLMVDALTKAGYLTKDHKVVGWANQLFKLAESYLSRTARAGRGSAAKRAERARIASRETRQEDKREEERRGESHAQHDVERDVDHPSFIPLSLGSADRGQIGGEYAITEAGIDRALADFNADRRRWFEKDGQPTIADLRNWLGRPTGQKVCAQFRASTTSARRFDNLF